MEDGLSFRHVTAITQDKQGFIWIGTRNGLNRFDGYTFEVYDQIKQNDLPSISNNYVHDLGVDKAGNVWIATETGLDCLNPVLDKIKSYSTKEAFPHAKGAHSFDEVTITEHTKRIFVHTHTKQTLNYFYTTSEYRNGKFHPLTINDNGVKFTHFANVFEDGNNNLWVRPATHHTFYQIDRNNTILKRVRIPKQISSMDISDAFGSSEEGDRRRNQEFIQIASSKGLMLYGTLSDGLSAYVIKCNFDKLQFEAIKDISLEPKHIPLNQFVDAEKNHWLRADTLQVRTATRTHKVHQVQLDENTTTCFYQSRDGTVWMGTNFGVYRIAKESNNFDFLLEGEINNLGYSRSTRAIAEGTDGSIFATVVHQGVWKEDKKGNVQQLLGQVHKSPRKEHNILPYGLHFHKNSLWLCNWFDDGILVLDLQTEKLEHIVAENNKVGFGRCLLERNSNSLWLGTDRGLNIVNLTARTAQRYQASKGAKTLNEMNISVLEKPKKGLLWIGSKNHGVYQLNEKGELSLVVDIKSGLSSDVILSIYEDETFLWVGTNAGLNRVNKKTKKVRVIGERDGLPDINIHAIQPQGDYLWMSTNKGLCRFNKKDQSTRTFMEQDGLIHEEFNFGSNYKLSNGDFLFGSMNGLVRIKKDGIKPGKNNYEFIITSIERFDESSNSIRSLRHDNKPLRIEADEKFFTVHFSLLDYFSNEQLTYSYKLEGYNDDWITIGTDHHIRFNKLPAGNYTLKIRAQGHDGNWNDETIDLPIEVMEVFYRTWWFISLCIIVFLGTVWGIYKYNVRQIRKVARIRIKLASDLHDDVGGTLTQIGMKAELMQHGIYEDAEKDREIGDIATQSRQAVEAMSDVIWTIDARRELMVDLIHRMQEYANQKFEKHQIDVKFKIDAPEKKSLSVTFKQNVYMIFKEAINNIIKHSNATELAITIRSDKKKFQLIIHDNGNEKQGSDWSSGQGVKNMNYRAKQLKGILITDNSNGYRVELRID